MKRVSYELWDIQTGNLVGGYDTEEAALAVVRHSIATHGRASVESLGLAREAGGRTKSIAVGERLALVAGPSVDGRAAKSWPSRGP